MFNKGLLIHLLTLSILLIGQANRKVFAQNVKLPEYTKEAKKL